MWSKITLFTSHFAIRCQVLLTYQFSLNHCFRFLFMVCVIMTCKMQIHPADESTSPTLFGINSVTQLLSYCQSLSRYHYFQSPYLFMHKSCKYRELRTLAACCYICDMIINIFLKIKKNGWFVDWVDTHMQSRLGTSWSWKHLPHYYAILWHMFLMWRHWNGLVYYSV